MKVILQVHGREMTFTKEELTAIVEKHFASGTTKQEHEKVQVVQGPREGEWFEVKPQAIDQSLFQKKREDEDQENTRQLILEAYEEVKKVPEKYGQFKTMMPKKEWKDKTVEELKEYATRIGDNMADWVEQALEWAQRIANGESWEIVCNEPDAAKWYRLVNWKDGYTRLVGGSHNYVDNVLPASDVDNGWYAYFSRLHDTVPLIVLRE